MDLGDHVGAFANRRAHPLHRAIAYVTHGKDSLHIGLVGERRTLGPGEMWRIPGGVDHKAIAGPAPVKALDVFCPVREDYR